MNIARSLFFGIWREIKFCEFQRLKSVKNGTFQLGEVEKCHKERFFEKVNEKYFSDEIKRGRMIDSYIFNVLRYKDENNENDFNIGKYKIKIYHMDDDEFRGNVYPLSWIDWMRLRWFNRKWFRIL